MKTEARHILMRYLVKNLSTGYGVGFKTSERVAVAKLRKEGYIEVVGVIHNYIPGLSVDSHDFVCVVPTEKLLNIKDSLLIINVK